MKKISLYFWVPNFHYVVYPVSNNNEAFNFIGVLNHKLTANELDNYSFFKKEAFIQGIKEKLQNKISPIILDNLNNIKYFPSFCKQKFPTNQLTMFF